MEEKVQLNANTFKNLISSLEELQLNDMVDHLQRSVLKTNCNNGIERPDTPTTENSDCISIDSSDDDSSREDDFHVKLQVVTKPLSINVKKATKFRDKADLKYIGAYPMRGNPRGYVLIIANNLYKKEKDRRPSAKHDEANLKKLFEDMGFKVITYFDLTGQEIVEKVKLFSQMPELRRADSAFIIISSHGSGKLGRQETEILGIDYNLSGYKKVVCTEIINYFTAENCDYLKGKPKVFIFQTCRGKNEQTAVPRYKTDTATSCQPRVEERFIYVSETMRNYEDMLIVYSTIPGYVSYRDEVNGSWFIQVLCEVFMNYAHKIDVQDLFKMIDYRLKNIRTPNDNCQTPSITTQGFNKYCFLNPGLFEEKHLNGNSEGNMYFKCCPDRRANVYFCTQCESIYHYKCVKKLDHVKVVGKTKADCCSENSENSENSQDHDIKFLSEDVEKLKKLIDELKEKNHNLKDRISSLETEHINIITNENTLINSEQQLKLEKLESENDYLKQIIIEIKDKNQLLIEKNDWLHEKMHKKKKRKWVKNNLSRVLKRRKRPSNSIEPVEI